MNQPSEEEFVAIVGKIARRLARIYKFGYHDVEDLVQHCYIEAIEGMKKWDRERPLVNFLSIHLRNRLHNLKRNKHARIATPCERCPLGAWVKSSDACKIYSLKEDCQLYYRWVITNTDKKNLSQPVHIGDSEINGHEDFDVAQFKDIYDKLKGNLSEFGQQIMFKIMNGDKVKPNELKAFQDEALEILSCAR